MKRKNTTDIFLRTGELWTDCFQRLKATSLLYLLSRKLYNYHETVTVREHYCLIYWVEIFNILPVVTVWGHFCSKTRRLDWPVTMGGSCRRRRRGRGCHGSHPPHRRPAGDSDTPAGKLVAYSALSISRGHVFSKGITRLWI